MPHALPLLFLCLQGPPAELRVQDLRAHIGFLASDELEGREAGTRGERLAVLYIAQQFERLGLQPAGADGSYLLPFDLKGKEAYVVAGLLPGTDARRSGEILVVGGHHDHVGIGRSGADRIHNGADDNASGTAGVLELAEWFAAHPARRPILFLTFGAEEKGLLGSQHFVQSGVVPRERLRAMLNLDMLGRSRDGYLFLGGLGTAEEFHELLDPLVRESGLRVETHDGGLAPSDNTSFYQAGIPSLFFFTHIHEDYHQPSDEADKINYEGEVAVLRLARAVAQALADHDGPLTFREQSDYALPADFYERMTTVFEAAAAREERRGRLGFRIEERATAEGALVVTEVREGSPAARAGLVPGDVLSAVDGQAIATKDDLRRLLAQREKGHLVELLVRRGGADQRLEVTLE